MYLIEDECICFQTYSSNERCFHIKEFYFSTTFSSSVDLLKNEEIYSDLPEMIYYFIHATIHANIHNSVV